jgi:hypothetical protein
MPNDSLSRWRQSHDFRHTHEGIAERRLRWVVGITVVTIFAASIWAGSRLILSWASSARP